MKCEVAELARQKHEEYKQLTSCIENALSAGLCPECGAELELRMDTITTKSVIGLLFKKIKTLVTRHASIVCPNGHKLTHPKYGDRSSPGCIVYEDCLNDEIRNYHLDNYGHDF